MRGTPRPFRQWKINSATLAVCQLSTDEGQIQIKHGDEWVDLVTAPARKVVEIRKTTVGWVSQFLRVIPRISALEVVMQPLLDTGVPREACAAKAARLLTRLNVPERLWHLAPSTFSGGEQQRVNIARGFIVDYPHSAARRTYRLAGR
ncbi:Phosphonates transport ATP-binding protein PhnL [Escherichia coli IS35]|nr:Phosphonates transport ATP-binding protein PhnL [Escherichia coli IS35]